MLPKFVRLIRHHLLSDINWKVIKDEVPIGIVYKVLDDDILYLENYETQKRLEIDCYLVEGNGSTGYLPKEVFEVIQ